MIAPWKIYRVLLRLRSHNTMAIVTTTTTAQNHSDDTLRRDVRNLLLLGSLTYLLLSGSNLLRNLVGTSWSSCSKFGIGS
jgi:hypothetical protein